MTHYGRTWDCLICGDRRESIDMPRLKVCELCLEPVARVLCRRDLGVDLASEGIDREYWMRKADATVGPMMRRHREPTRGR